MKTTDDDREETVRDRLTERSAEKRTTKLVPETTRDEPANVDDLRGEVAFWRGQFERERERLAKLWVAYKDVEAELELRKGELEEMEERAAEPKKPAASPAQPTPGVQRPKDRPTGAPPAPPKP